MQMITTANCLYTNVCTVYERQLPDQWRTGYRPTNGFTLPILLKVNQGLTNVIKHLWKTLIRLFSHGYL